jgi:hypothetical protein
MTTYAIIIYNMQPIAGGRREPVKRREIIGLTVLVLVLWLVVGLIILNTAPNEGPPLLLRVIIGEKVR